MSKIWQVYAQHILDVSKKLQRILERGNIIEDDILYDAALRNLQTLSESTQYLPEELKKEYSQIPWTQIHGFRNILAHNYLGNIDAATVLKIIHENIPPLVSVVKNMLMNKH